MSTALEMPAPSLVDLCTKSCIKNIARLTDVGDFEYWKIQPILARITSPEQLHEIELASPQIRGEDADLWKAFIARDFPNWKGKNYVPKNPFRWYDVYLKYRRELERELEKSREMLSAAMQGLEREKRANVSKKVNSKFLPRQPRDPRMLSNDGGVPIEGRRKAAPKPGRSALTFLSGSKTRMKNAGSVLIRARREAKEISSRTRLSIPSHQLKSGAAQVTQAPRHMIEQYRKATEPERKIHPPTKVSGTIGSKVLSSSGPSLEERERRLRALTMSSHGPGVTLVSSESEDASDDIDDLFEEKTEAHLPPEALPISKPVIAAASSVRKPSDKISSIISRPKQPPAAESSVVKPVSPVRKPFNVWSRPIIRSKNRSQSPPQFTSPPPPAAATTSPRQVAAVAASPVNRQHGSSERPIGSSRARSQTPSPTVTTPPSVAPTSPGTVIADPTNRFVKGANIVRKRKAAVDIFNRGGSATKEKRQRQL